MSNSIYGNEVIEIKSSDLEILRQSYEIRQVRDKIVLQSGTAIGRLAISIMKDYDMEICHVVMHEDCTMSAFFERKKK
jgi:CRISPR/Cas system-associated protein Csm6